MFFDDSKDLASRWNEESLRKAWSWCWYCVVRYSSYDFHSEGYVVFENDEVKQAKMINPQNTDKAHMTSRGVMEFCAVLGSGLLWHKLIQTAGQEPYDTLAVRQSPQLSKARKVQVCSVRQHKVSGATSQIQTSQKSTYLQKERTLMIRHPRALFVSPPARTWNIAITCYNWLPPVTFLSLLQHRGPLSPTIPNSPKKSSQGL